MHEYLHVCICACGRGQFHPLFAVEKDKLHMLMHTLTVVKSIQDTSSFTWLQPSPRKIVLVNT
jgi:hypothetical protein